MHLGHEAQHQPAAGNKRVYLFTIFVAVGCLVAMTVDQSAALMVHFLLGKLLYSTSQGAVLLFLVLFIIGACIALWHSRRLQVLQVIPGWVLPLAMLAGNMLNILSFVIYQRQLDISVNIPFYHWRDLENSFSYLLHNHTGKTALSAIASTLGITEKITAFDTGQVFTAHVPLWLTGSLAVLLIGSIALFLFTLPGILQKYTSNFPVFFLYFLAFAGCLKTMVDGGPLTYRFFPSLVVLFSITFAGSTEQLCRQWKCLWGPILVVVTLPLLYLWQQLSPDKWTAAIAPFLFLLATFGFLLLLAGASRTVMQTMLKVGLAGFLLLSTTVEFLLFDASYFTRIDERYRVVHVDFKTFAVRDVSDESQGLAVHEVYRRYSNSPLKPKNVFIWHEQDTGLHAMQLTMIPITYSGATGAFPAQDMIGIRSVALADRRDGALDFSLATKGIMPPIFSSSYATLFSRNNHYCYLHLVGQLFMAAGITEFVMIPMPGIQANQT